MQALTRSIFETKFKSRLENSCDTLHDRISSNEASHFITWTDLLRETEESLERRSKSRKNTRRRARNFAKSTLRTDEHLFIICVISFTISNLPTIPNGSLYDLLEEWWQEKKEILDPPKRLLKAIGHLIRCDISLYPESKLHFLELETIDGKSDSPFQAQSFQKSSAPLDGAEAWSGRSHQTTENPGTETTNKTIYTDRESEVLKGCKRSAPRNESLTLLEKRARSKQTSRFRVQTKDAIESNEPWIEDTDPEVIEPGSDSASPTGDHIFVAESTNEKHTSDRASLGEAGATLENDIIEAAEPTQDNSHVSFILNAGEVPGLQLYILRDQSPQSVFELRIEQLIAWIQRYQSQPPSIYPNNITGILEHLEYYRISCPTLRYLQLIVPWRGSLPYIYIKTNSKSGQSAKVQMTTMVAADLIHYISGSWAPTETSHNDVT